MGHPAPTTLHDPVWPGDKRGREGRVMTVAADPPLTPSFRHILSSNEIVSRQAMFTRNDTEAVREKKRLFRLLGTINLLVRAAGVFGGLTLATAIARSLLSGWATELRSATTILGFAITAFPSSSGESSITSKYREHTEPLWPCGVQMEGGR